MIDALNNLDGNLLLWFNGSHCAYWDDFMFMFTGKWIWVPMYIAIFIYLCRGYGTRRVITYLLAIVLAIVLADQICATVLRPVFQRMRPSNPDNPMSQFVQVVNGYRGGKYGFPSCHAANSVALTVIVCLIARYRYLTIFMASWAILTCVTRMYLGVHYPGDILFGSFIGASVGMGCYYLTRLVKNDNLPAKHSPAIIIYVELATIAYIFIAAAF